MPGKVCGFSGGGYRGYIPCGQHVQIPKVLSDVNDAPRV